MIPVVSAGLLAVALAMAAPEQARAAPPLCPRARGAAMAGLTPGFSSGLEMPMPG